MSGEKELFEQSSHTSDGFGGQRYEAPGGGFRTRPFAKAEPSRMVPWVGLQVGRDLGDVAKNGSPQAKRRAKVLRRFLMFVYLGAALVLIASAVLGW